MDDSGPIKAEGEDKHHVGEAALEQEVADTLIIWINSALRHGQTCDLKAEFAVESGAFRVRDARGRTFKVTVSR